MKRKSLTIFSLLLLGSICTSGCYLDLGFIRFGTKSETTDNTNNETEEEKKETEDLSGGYYDSIDSSLSGTRLLTALRTLNSQMKKKDVGYAKMGTTASLGMFKYTDYDFSKPDKLVTDANGQVYGTTIVSFYSGNKTSTYNREHVWPNTHGGHLVEDDIHMVRPTISSENSARGHSFFVEGMASSSNDGWDPAAESFGKESYRGDAARIIFYCMVASDQLTLVDDASRSHYTNNYEMGVISDMISWNARYSVTEREQRRNSGAQYLQGNRNPFIDHPEYACKIWGSTNQKTRTACQNANYAID